MLEELRAEVEAGKRRLAAHPLYASVSTKAALRAFMERHVVCVLDFMSLLKSLQRDLTCTALPWRPPAHPELARLINEIVLGEESDELEPGRYGSHFEWYLEAMREVGADTAPVRELVRAFAAGVEPARALTECGLPPESVAFGARTFALIDAPVATRAAVFFHGREDVIPRMFLPLALSLEASGEPCGALVGYLRRHVDLDGGVHGPAAERMLERLFRGDLLAEAVALEAVRDALAAREALWDAITDALGRGTPRAA